MKATETLHEQGQSLWLDNITRSMLDNGVVQRYIDRYSVTGLTSNPSIFDKAIQSGDYDDAIREKAKAGLSGEDLFFELAIEDLQRAADLFLPIHERTARHRRLVLARGLARARVRHREDGRCREGPLRARRSAQPVHQDPGHRGGPPCDRGSHCEWRARERDAPLRRGAVPGGRRRLHEGDRAARRATTRIRSSGRWHRCSSRGGTRR